ncbi:MAG: DUF420 domain-containing protein [Planctomycetales bacterium]|nr:DUF420 domain-containing protein [Planctomycetales bacterium]
MVQWLPHVNVSLNGLATLLLISGYVLIKRKQIAAHRRVMLSTLAVSIVFLISYLIYHFNVPTKPFPNDPAVASAGVRYFYLSLLASHIVLAALVPFLAVWTIYLGLSGAVQRHRKWARWTWPIWLYVSVTGVIVYLMLYQIYVPHETTT